MKTTKFPNSVSSCLHTCDVCDLLMRAMEAEGAALLCCGAVTGGREGRGVREIVGGIGRRVEGWRAKQSSHC